MHQPSDYYFCLDRGVTDDDLFFLFTSIKYWDEHNCLDDRGNCVDERILPEGFNELMESVYEFNGDSFKAREELLDLGFVENTNMGSNPFIESEEKVRTTSKTKAQIKSGWQVFTINELEQRLKGAVAREDFEIAAQIRDEIVSRNKK